MYKKIKKKKYFFYGNKYLKNLNKINFLIIYLNTKISNTLKKKKKKLERIQEN